MIRATFGNQERRKLPINTKMLVTLGQTALKLSLAKFKKRFARQLLMCNGIKPALPSNPHKTIGAER